MAAGTKHKMGPSKAEVLALKKALQAIAKPFFDKYGSKPHKGKKGKKAAKASADSSGGEGGIDFLLIGPPGPRPPPKLEIEILNLSSY